MRNILWGALAALAISGVASAMDITAPGVTVPSGQTGVLQADLICPPNTSGISLEDRSRLDLNGHVVECFITTHTTERRDVKIKGPGTIRNAGIGLGPGKVLISNLTIQDAPTWSIRGAWSAFEEPTTVIAKRVTCTGPAMSHISSSMIRAINVTVSGASGNGIEGGTVSGSHIQANDNGYSGIFSSAGKMRLTHVTATGNGCGGVFGFEVALRVGQVTGNAVGDPTCADIYSGAQPMLTRVTCGISSDTNFPSNTWGLCALD